MARVLAPFMIGALLYLRFVSIWNQVVFRVKRLRNLRYLAGAAAGAAYFWFFFFRPVFRPGLGAAAGPGAAAAAAAMAAGRPLLALFGSALLFLILLAAWVLPTAKPGLAFTEAETAFLFPAPLTRRALINFKLLSSQFSILFSALFFTLLSNRWGGLGGNAVTHALGWWVILSAISLHSAGAVLCLTRLFNRGVSTWRRRALVLGGLGLILAATLALIWGDLRAPTADEVSGIEPLERYLITLLDGGAIHWLLWPCRLIIRPFLAADWALFLAALGPALVLLAAIYFWVMQMEVSFEEGSLAKAEHRTAVIAQMRAGTFRPGRTKAKARRAPFHLAGAGWPPLAFLWKNLLSTPTWLSLRTFRVVAVLIVVGCLAAGHRPEWRPALVPVSIFAAGVGAYVFVIGAQFARQDLRRDLANADLLKTYPLPGWQVLLGELLTPAAILCGVLWLLLLTAALALQQAGVARGWITAPRVTLFAICLAAVLPLITTVQLLVPNGVVVVFPGWFQSDGSRGRGIDVMGQRLIMVFGQLLVLLLALLPAAIVAAVQVLAFYWIVGLPAAVILATLTVMAMLVGEIACGLWFVGRRFENFDLSADRVG